MQSIENKVLARIYGRGRGWAFTKIDFLADLPDVDIRKALSNLKKKGVIRSVCRGVYDYPKYSDLLKQNLSPDIELVAYAIARKFKWRIQPSGNTALNYLGLSTQIPANYLYRSDGPTRSYQIEKTALNFKNSVLKEAGFKYRESALIVQALKELGKDNVDESLLEKIKNQLPQLPGEKILKDTKHVTGWVHAYIKKMYQDNPNG